VVVESPAEYRQDVEKPHSKQASGKTRSLKISGVAPLGVPIIFASITTSRLSHSR
jgi:hypothetical protein